ncbi:MAG: DUF6920 family protein [Longimicrobiales bacterium]
MKRWKTVAGAAAGTVLAGAAAAVGAGRAAWSRQTARALARLRGAALAGPPEPPVTPAQLDALPAPVARYLKMALPEGFMRPAIVRVVWSGEFQSRPAGGWAPFDALQTFTTVPPGFVWDASIRMLPFLPVQVRDSYIAGGAAMNARMGGILPMANETGNPEIARSALTRWLAESAWFPAVLADEPVSWELVSDGVARATVTDGAVEASADFHFNPTGELAKLTTERHRFTDGENVLTPFEGRYFSYIRWNGVMVPARAEVAWLLPEGRYAYWRGSVERIEHEI